MIANVPPTLRRGLVNQTWVSVAGAVLMLAVAVALLGLALFERDQHFSRVRERNVLLARVFADHATRSVDGAALAAATIDELLSRGIAPEGPQMSAALAQTLVSLPFLRGIAIVDAQGLIVGSADGTELNLAIDIARLGLPPGPGRDALGPFVGVRRLADLGALGSAEPASGVGFVPLLRGAVLPGGQRAMVVASINVDALANFQQVTMGDVRAAAALVGLDGRFIAATAGVDRRVGESLAALPPFTEFLPDREHGSWDGPGLRPGDQLGAFRLSRTRPLAVLVEYDAEAAAAEWWRDSRPIFFAGVAALLFVGTMTLLASRSMRARDRAQTAVVQREQDLKITLESLQELVFRCDAQGRLTFVNAQWHQLTGGSDVDALGRPLADWVPARERTAVEALFSAAAGARVRHGRVSLVNAAGMPRSFDFSVMPLLDKRGVAAFAGSAVDVTERVQAQRRLEAQLGFSELLLESSPLPMSVMSRDRRYLMVNRAWEAFTGRPRSAVIGQPVGGHLPQEQRALHEQQDEQVYASEGAVRYDARVTHADGSLRDVVVEKRALPGEDGSASGMLAVVIDVTEFRAAERATREARDSAEESSRAKSEFIANISHELRTPLQSIIGFSELGLRRSGEQVRLGAMFGDIHASGQRMLSLVNDLLDVARLESTVGTVHLERTDLRGLVREVMHELEPIAAKRQLGIEAALPEQPMRAKVDPLRFLQVLRNVLANAVKFSPEGSVVAIEGGPAADGGWRLAVADRGPGVPESERERIFEAFVQSSLTKDGSGGTGLGLAICRKIMEAHGGHIAALPREGGGSVFEILLPPGAAGETQPAPL